MRSHLSRGNILFFCFLGVALLGVLFSRFLWPFQGSQIPDATLPGSPTNNVINNISNAIVNENSHPGTSSWQIVNKEATVQIQAYAGATSVSPGQKLTFYVSTQHEGTRYSISIYRLGWYGGLDGRLISFRASQIGHAQGYFDASTKHLVGVEYARDRGIGLGFLGADAADWQIRFEPDSMGVPNRTIICYKVLTQSHDLALDPLYGKDDTRVTSLWRDPVVVNVSA
jgi:N,N-dimethylformamidase beta subunit-like, C-terminal